MKVGDHAMYGGDKVVVFEVHPDGWLRANFVDGGTLSCHESRLTPMPSAKVPATPGNILVAYLVDRRAQYDEASGIYCAIGELIDGIKAGAHTDAHAYGEYDDILSDSSVWPWRQK